MALTAKGPETLLQRAWKLLEDDHQRHLGENSREEGRKDDSQREPGKRGAIGGKRFHLLNVVVGLAVIAQRADRSPSSG